MPANNIAIARHYIEQINKGNHNLAFACIAADVAWHGFGKASNLQGWKQIHGMFVAAFPDMHFTIDDEMCAGDKVVARWTVQATHKGDWLGLAPTGKHVKLSSAFIDNLALDKVVEHWIFFDQLTLRQQLGQTGVVGLDLWKSVANSAE